MTAAAARSSGPRVAIGGLGHETNTFTPVATSFEDFTWISGRGDELLERFKGTNTPTGGFVAGAAEEGFDILPTQIKFARPSAPVPHEDFERLVSELVDSVESVLPVDGLLLDLHGAMATEGCDDAEAELLRSLRLLIGQDVPIVAQLDIHANLTHEMVDHATLLVGRRTYPEVDMGDRGRDCARLLGRLIRGEVEVTPALCRLPLIWGTAQTTVHGEMAALMKLVDKILLDPAVLTVCVLPGFGPADTRAMGSSVYVATDGSLERAWMLADELAEWIVDHADSWYEDLPTTRDAIEGARAGDRYPVVFADYLDNTGSGAPGDGTAMLRSFLEAGLERACVLYIVDNESVERCQSAGVGATIDLSIGGHSHPSQGPPVDAQARVVSLSDGRFTYTTLNAGLESSLGPSALVDVGGVLCVLVTRREQPLDPSFALSLGLDCRRMSWIGLKSKQHFRAGFEEFAGLVQLVEEPNAVGPNRQYTRLNRPLYPLDPDALDQWARARTRVTS